MVQMNVPPESVVSAAVFKGINQTDGCSTASQSSSKYWEFKDAHNASSDCFPALCGRKGSKNESFTGITFGTPVKDTYNCCIVASVTVSASAQREEIVYYILQELTPLEDGCFERCRTLWARMGELNNNYCCELSYVSRISNTLTDRNPPVDLFVFGNKLVVHDNGEFYQGEIPEDASAGGVTELYRVDEIINVSSAKCEIVKRKEDGAFATVSLWEVPDDTDFKPEVVGYYADTRTVPWSYYHFPTGDQSSVNYGFFPVQLYSRVFYDSQNAAYFSRLQAGDRLKFNIGFDGQKSEEKWKRDNPSYRIIEINTEEQWLVLDGAVAPSSWVGSMFSEGKIPIDVDSKNNAMCGTPFPENMDRITLCNNRVWGISSKDSTTIYASEQGNYRNWYTFDTSSYDSFAQGVASGGCWTGICSYNGYPYAFKEREIVRIGGTKPSNFYPSSLVCDGVEYGSERSISVVDGYLLWQGKDGVYLYSGGGYPTNLTEFLPDSFGFRYGLESKCSIAMRSGHKYMIVPYAWSDAMQDKMVYIYDLRSQVWHKMTISGQVYGAGRIYHLGEFYLKGYSLVAVDHSENRNSFTVESAWINRLDDGYQYIEKLFLQISGTSEIEAAFAYDGGEFMPKRLYRAQNGLVTIPLGQRSNTFTFRLFVPQNGKIHVLGYAMQQGGNHSGRF